MTITRVTLNCILHSNIFDYFDFVCLSVYIAVLSQ